METNANLDILKSQQDPKRATKSIVDVIFRTIWPLVLDIRQKLQNTNDGLLADDEVAKLQDIFLLCSSQIKKCLQSLFDIFKMEYHQRVFLQESRQCLLERLSWCIDKLHSIDKVLNELSNRQISNEEGSLNNSILNTPMYFVNWIDCTFDSLAKLSEIVYKGDCKEDQALYEQWKVDVADCVSTLHISIDELLLSAMTLYKYFLPTDQLIVKTRCQVVLRETNPLFSELVTGDIDAAFKATPESLKLPLMPSNIDVLIGILKNVLYALETNINTALLALLPHSFSYNVFPIDVLKEHLKECSCSGDDVTEDCQFVKDFDLFNERLFQLGSFAVSCSSDQNRMLSLRSGLASLEALDPHLVPALTLAPDSHHANILVKSWREEVHAVRNEVFLIVDPAPFVEKSKQTMHQMLLDLINKDSYCNADVCPIINLGHLLHEFFAVYNEYEPNALPNPDKLLPLLADLNKVQLECKVTSNMLSSGDDFVYDVKKPKTNKEATFHQLLKRLKLLYTVVTRINTVLHPRDAEDSILMLGNVNDTELNDVTYTVDLKAKTCTDTPKQANNVTRSVFARTANAKSFSKFPLSKLTKHLKSKKVEELNFSLQLDELFNLSEVNDKVQNRTKNFVNRNLESLREPSVLYNFSAKKRSSLRRAVLSRQCKLGLDKQIELKDAGATVSESQDLLDDDTSLQITEILNNMDMTTIISSKPRFNSTENARLPDRSSNGQILKIRVNEDSATISKHIWNIPVNAPNVGMPLDESIATMDTDMNTLERINDIDLVESKLHSLKYFDIETTL